MEPAIISPLIVLLAVSVSCAQNTDTLTFTQPEEQGVGQFVGSVSTSAGLIAMVGDSDRASLKYAILNDASSKAGDLFRVGESGNISFAAVIDRERSCPSANACELSFSVTVGGNSNFFKLIPIKVVITDVNDNGPIFADPVKNLSINEAALVGSPVSLVAATDADMSKEFGVNSYILDPDSDVFGVVATQTQDGVWQVDLVLKQALDREAADTYKLSVIAKDGGDPPRSATLTVNLVVEDYNDNAPVFTSAVYSAIFNETAGAGYPIITVTATDRDIRDNGRIGYSLNTVRRLSTVQPTSDLHDKIFVNSTSGLISLTQPLERGAYRIVVDATDFGLSPLKNQTVVNVTVRDSENTRPVVRLSPVTNSDLPPGWVYEETAGAGTVVAVLTAEDRDSGKNGNVSCECLEPSFQLQQLDATSYKITLAKALDRERNDSFSVAVVCRDQGSPSLNGTGTIPINVRDINDNYPIFGKSSYVSNIVENNMKGDTVVVVNALDADKGENARVEYKLVDDDGNFTISPGTGVVRANRVFDWEDKTRYVFRVLAVDNGSPRLTGTASVTVNILDVNDVAPRFSQDGYKFQVYENREPSTVVGNLTVSDPDKDEGGDITLTLEPLKEMDSLPFTVTRDGRVLSTESFDREAKSTYIFHVIATDNGQRKLSSSVQVSVQILDMNDNRPTFVFPSDQNFSTYVNAPVNAEDVLLTVEVYDEDEGKNSDINYSIVGTNASDLFRIGKVSGEIIAKRDIDVSEIGAYSLTINASDQGYPALWTSRSLLLVVQSESPYAGKVIADQNVLIVACIICFTVIVSGAVLVAMCIIRRLDRQRKLQYAADQNLGSDGLEARQQYDLAKSGSKDQLDPGSLYHQRSYAPQNSKDSKISPPTGNASDKAAHIPGTSGQNFYTHTQSNHGPETTQVRQEDFHSTSSTETSTGDSGHGSDEDMSNSLDHTNIPPLAVEHAAPPLTLASTSRQSASRASFPNLAQRPSLLKSSTRAKNSSVRFDPHVSYDQIQPLRDNPPTPTTFSVQNHLSSREIPQPVPPPRLPHKFDLLVHQQHQQPAHHQLHPVTYAHQPRRHPQAPPPQPPHHQHVPLQGRRPSISSIYSNPNRLIPLTSQVSLGDDDSDLNTTTSGSYSVASDDVGRLSSFGDIKDLYV